MTRSFASRTADLLEQAKRDLRFSVHLLMKSRSFTVAAILTLAVAIGANAVVFSAVNGFVLRPLNVPREESLYHIERSSDEDASESYPNYIDLRDRNRSFESLAAEYYDLAWLDTGQEMTQASFYEVSGNYFDVLGVRPYLGQFFHAADEHGANSAPYIVLTYSYWRVHFQADRSVIGRKVEISRHPFTIIGVAPPGFRGTVVIVSPEFFVPIVNQEQVEGTNLLTDRGRRWLQVFGHIRPGTTTAQVTADLNGIGASLAKLYPRDDDKLGFRLTRTHISGDAFERPVHQFLIALLLLAALILLAACANLGSLFAARTADRSREIALRLALGASRSRILSQLFTEALLVAVVGGAFGLWSSIWLLDALATWRPFPQFALTLPIEPDARVFGAAIGLSLLSGLLFGAVPVRQVLRTNPHELIKSGSRSTPDRRMTVRDLLLGVQIAVCAVLVTSAAVAVRGLVRSLHSDFGFNPRNVVLVETDLSMSGYRAERIPAVQAQMADAVRANSWSERGRADCPVSAASRRMEQRDRVSRRRDGSQTSECRCRASRV